MAVTFTAYYLDFFFYKPHWPRSSLKPTNLAFWTALDTGIQPALRPAQVPNKQICDRYLISICVSTGGRS